MSRNNDSSPKQGLIEKRKYNIGLRNKSNGLENN
jgi:hypothetical protein